MDDKIHPASEVQQQCTLVFYLHEEDADDESGSLAVAHLAIMQRIGFHDVEETLLAQAVLLFEEIMFRVRAGNVTPNHLLNSSNKILRI